MVLLGVGIGAFGIALALWLGGRRHSTVVMAVLGAVVGSAAGLPAGTWLHPDPWVGILVGAAAGAGLFLVLKNVLMLALVVLVFSAAGGAVSVAVVLDRAGPSSRSEAEIRANEVPPSFRDMNLAERLIYMNGISRRNPAFLAQSRALLGDTWKATGPNGWMVALVVAGGALLGILLVRFTRRGAIALACSFVGTMAIFVGVQTTLLAAGEVIISDLGAHRGLLPIIFLGVTLIVWVWQVCYGGWKRPAPEFPEGIDASALNAVGGEMDLLTESASAAGMGPVAEDQRLGRELERSDGSLGQFLSAMLATECLLGPAESGAVLRRTDEASVDVLALRPAVRDKTSPPPWVRTAAELTEQTVAANRPLLAAWPPRDQYYTPSGQHVLLLPVCLAQTGVVVIAFLVNATDSRAVETIRERLRLSLSLLVLSESRQGSQQAELALRRVRQAGKVLAAVNRWRQFDGTATALCRETAAQWQCDRATLGVPKGHYVQIAATSDTRSLNRKRRVRRDIESAMEECLDQDCDVLHPGSEGGTCISRQAAELSRRHGPLTIASLPIRYGGKVWGVLTLERSSGRPFAVDEVEAIRLALELCTARVAVLREQDRWLGTRLAHRLGKALAVVLGLRYVWAKAAALLILAVMLFLTVAKGNYRAEASFLLEGTQSQVVPAPFDGYLKTVNVEVGDAIRAGETFLAELDAAELRLQLAEAKADQAGYLKQVDVAMRDGQTAQAQIAEANAQKAQAQMDLLEYMIGQAKVLSPLSGIVVQGDLKRQIGGPVKMGDVLFEVMPLESLRAVLYVREDQITDVRVGQQGSLATASYPAQRIAFEVERINPMAEVVKQKNVFKVRVRLLELYPWMRPGMEGVAKVDLGRRSYAWIWTRRIVNWVRMKLWL
jgi:biotin carboxyl carrier protein